MHTSVRMDGISANRSEEMERQVGRWEMVVLCRQPLVQRLQEQEEATRARTGDSPGQAVSVEKWSLHRPRGQVSVQDTQRCTKSISH